MPKNKPFFSIIIPALNEAKYLPKLLGDLAGQTFRDFEVIVVDGNSNDTTVVKAKSFIKSLPRLTVIASPTRHVCVQRNLGAKQAKADIFVFIEVKTKMGDKLGTPEEMVGLRKQKKLKELKTVLRFSAIFFDIPITLYASFNF